MEDNNILDHDLPDDLLLNEAVKLNIKKAFKWGKILAVMLFVFSGFMILFYFKLVTTETRRAASGSQTILTIVLLTFIICIFFAAFNLLGFANQGKISLEKNSNKHLSICIESLKAYFKFYGIFLLIITLLFIIAMFSILGYFL